MPTNKSEYMKSYYEKHKDKLKAYAVEKKYCECCNKYISKANWVRHCASDIHKKNEEMKKIKASVNPIDEEFVRMNAVKILEEYKRLLLEGEKKKEEIVEV
jgi:hypothetical protein